ncbi:MAG: hypothetical protein QM775_16850 [Pirellulales bacterium]
MSCAAFEAPPRISTVAPDVALLSKSVLELPSTSDKMPPPETVTVGLPAEPIVGLF